MQPPFHLLSWPTPEVPLPLSAPVRGAVLGFTLHSASPETLRLGGVSVHRPVRALGGQVGNGPLAFPAQCRPTGAATGGHSRQVRCVTQGLASQRARDGAQG